MTELAIFDTIALPLLAFCALYLVPISIWRFSQQVKAIKAGEASQPEANQSIPTTHINFIDIFVVLAVSGYAWLGAKYAGEGIITVGSLLAGLLSQVFAIGFVVLLWIFRANLIDTFGLKLLQLKHLSWCLGIVLFAWGITALFQFAGYFSFLESYYGKAPLQEAVQILQSSEDIVLLSLIALLACVGAPLMEEVLFRGYIYPVVKKFSGTGVALMFSGVLFSLIHYNLASLPTLIVLGVLLALAYEKTRCLWVPIITHSIFNSATVGFQLLSRVTEIQP